MSEVERDVMEVDLVCVGFGPATGGFLTTLSRGMEGLESRVMPGLPPQVLCYERADDIGFGVSGVVTRARGIRASLPDLDPAQIPMAAPVTAEKVLYLLDPLGASRRPALLRVADRVLGAVAKHSAIELPYTPEFLHKKDGLVLSIGQFNQWVGQQIMMSGLVQIWPGTPVARPVFEGKRVTGVQLVDQGMPGMEIRAGLTVVGDGPVGAVGRAIDARIGLPGGHSRDEWAVGMKMVVELPESCDLPAGTVFHTLGFPEPEIFGFFYVHPDRLASVGIFVPSWFQNPIRTSYRYLQHFIQHPYLWRYLQGGVMKSWGAKSLFESGRRGEPFLAGDGFARIGEGSGSTNVLTGSGVDEAWTTGVQLAEAVLELWKAGQEFTRENLLQTYVRRRRDSWVEAEAAVAEKARDGFQRGFVQGLIGMMLSGISGGRLNWPGRPRQPHEILQAARGAFQRDGRALLMEKAGWPPIPYDGQLLVTHQDALLMGGKVQAPPGYADHVTFVEPRLCETCGIQTCVEMCSGEALHPAEGGGHPLFDREKCIHCGACLWNCVEGANIEFSAGAGGLHSAVN
ncbi:MAG: 4Fe-4S ferredoxin [Bryobacteraceae bacterium]